MERAARHYSVYAAGACAVIALSLAAAPARANITWEWSFPSENGTFVTDGSLVGGTAPAGNYTVDPNSLNVTRSSVPSLVGAPFMQNQTPQGFLWDGSEPTQFWRTLGPGILAANGMNFFLLDWSSRYCFDTGGCLLASDGSYYILLDPVVLRPLSAVTTPVPGSVGLVVMGLLSIRRLRSR